VSDGPEHVGPVVRPYTVTRGRVQSAAYRLDLVTLVVALRDDLAWADPYGADPHGADPHWAEPEHRQILRLCRQPVSVAEVAARTSLPISVVKVLLGDLIEHRQLIFRSPSVETQARDPQFLQAVLNGIRDI
jgi:hypothetical protein